MANLKNSCCKDEGLFLFYSETLRQTEIRLEDLNQIASSADNRAMAFAAATAAIGAGILAVNAELPHPPTALISAIGFVFSSFISTWSCLPRSFHVRGHNAEDWLGHLTDQNPILEALKTQAIENDDRIKDCNKSLNKSATWFRRSYLASGITFSFLLGSQTSDFTYSLALSLAKTVLAFSPG